MMHQHRPRGAFRTGMFVLLGAGLLAAALQADRASGVSDVTKPTTIAVTLGAPSALSVKLSKESNIAAGSIVFNVTGKGDASVKHTFKVCTTATKALANTCAGKAVTVSGTARTRSLTLKLAKTGSYEFIATATGQSALGRKGWIGVGKAVSTKTVVIPKPGSGGNTGTTTTPAGNGNGNGNPGAPTTFPPGNAASGASVFAAAACASCHTMAAAGATGAIGPNLDQVKPTVAAIEAQVFAGGGEMPAYGGQLTNQQIADLAQYVYNSTR